MEGQQRIGVIVELPQVLREMGEDPERIISSVGIDPDKLRDCENSISFIELGRLLQACTTATGCEHFGLLVGQRGGTPSLGLVGQLMRNAPTLKAAILDLCTNQRRYVSGAVAYLLIQNETAFWGYAIHHPTMKSVEQVSEGAMAVARNMLLELAGVCPEQVLIARRAPNDTGPYGKFFGHPPIFDAQQYAVAFPAAWLTLPVQGADRELRRRLEGAVADYWALTQPSITQTVVRLLHARVVFPDATLEALADDLSMHPRTLNRRLQAEGANFRDLVNEARFAVARQLLVGTRMEVTDIAFALGYSNLSSFTHAFQRWAAIAPIRWRIQNAQMHELPP